MANLIDENTSEVIETKLATQLPNNDSEEEFDSEVSSDASVDVSSLGQAEKSNCSKLGVRKAFLTCIQAPPLQLEQQSTQLLEENLYIIAFLMLVGKTFLSKKNYCVSI